MGRESRFLIGIFALLAPYGFAAEVKQANLHTTAIDRAPLEQTVSQGEFTPISEGSAKGTSVFDPPLVVDGEPWSFRTPPPSSRRVITGHPRLLMTSEDLPELRRKLRDPIYSSRMKRLLELAEQGDMAANALLYQLNMFGQRELFAGRAKEALLDGRLLGEDYHGGALRGYSAVATFDWIFELLTPPEREKAFRLVLDVVDRKHSNRPPMWYGNDAYARWPGLFKGWLALAANGEGIDDAAVEDILARCYGEIEDSQTWGVYDPRKGAGMLDVLNSIGLDTGGSQAGSHGDRPCTGYTSMYLTGAPVFLFGWDTATGGRERVAARCTYLRRLSHWLAYEMDRWVHREGATFAYLPGPNRGALVCEYLTGVYKTGDPDMAALAAWILEVSDVDPRKYYNWLVPALVLGDLRVQPKSPEELGLSTAAYLRGADAFYSMSSWRDDATRVVANVRYLDTSRYEPSTNTFRISKFGFLATGSQTGKHVRGVHNHAGIWFYEPGSSAGNDTYFQPQQGSTYWSGLRYPTRRAESAWQVAHDPAYFAGGPSALGTGESYRFVQADAARLMRSDAVQRYCRTLVHLPPLGRDREFVVVHDRTELAEDKLQRAWGLRAAVEPVVDGQPAGAGVREFSGARLVTIENRLGNCHGVMHLSPVLPADPLVIWRGGPGHETEGPDGQVYKTKHKFESGLCGDVELRYKFGVGNLFIRAPRFQPKQNFLVVMQVGDALSLGPNQAARPLHLEGQGSDAVQVDQWVLAFGREAGLRASARYRLAGDGAQRHIVFDLKPGRYLAAKNGRPIELDLATAEGDFSLSFAADGDKGDLFHITPRLDVSP